MRSTNPAITKAVNELARVRGELKSLSLREEELKTEIKAHMGAQRLMVASDWAVVIETRNQSVLDKTALSHDMGLEFIKKYSKLNSYDVLSLKPLTADVKNG